MTIDWNGLANIGTVAAAFVSLLALWVATRQSRHTEKVTAEDKMSSQVSKEVDAKIGANLTALWQFESEARTKVDQLIKLVDERRDSFSVVMREREQAMAAMQESADSQARRVEELLDRASSLIPMIEHADAVPHGLLREAASADSPKASEFLLRKILEHPDSDSSVLERAGDRARQHLENFPLARQLYSRACVVDPENVSVQAELLGLEVKLLERRESARQELLGLAEKNPNHVNVLSKLFDMFIHESDMVGLEQAAMKLLSLSSLKSLLWRNIAVARQTSGVSDNDVEDAYKSAFDAAEAARDEGSWANAAKPYIDYLRRRGHLDQALSVADRALRLMALSAPLLISRGDVLHSLGRGEEAARCYAIAAQVGDSQDQVIANMRLQNAAILQKLNIVPATGTAD